MFQPDSDIRRSSTLAAFLDDCGADSYEDLARRANVEPEWFWGRIIDYAGICFNRPYTQLRDISQGPESIHWAVGGDLNLTETCLDARISEGLADKTAIDWVGEDGSRRRWTYAELAAEAARIASALATRGVKPGQAIGIYMPMIPEIAAALLGIARLGAVAVPLFSGFAPTAIVSRLKDAGAVAVLTADATPRRGKPVWMEAAMAEALKDVPSIHTVFSLRRFGGAAADPARDLDWEESVDNADPTQPAHPVKADAPLLIAYTSGTTGRPKGVVHTHIGVQAKAAADFLLCLDMKRDDRH
ncbi:AMP-binding protein, partial [Sulfitobacter sp.]